MAEQQGCTNLDERNLYVQMLPLEFGEMELYLLFGEYGEVNFTKTFIDYRKIQRTCSGMFKSSQLYEI